MKSVFGSPSSLPRFLGRTFGHGPERLHGQFFFPADDGSGSGEGAGGGTGGEGGSNTGGANRVRPSDLIDRFNGDALKMAEKLADAQNDNFDYRQKVNNLTTTVTTLTNEVNTLKGNVPKEGSVVLAKEDAALLESYKVHGTPEDFDKAKKELVTEQKRNSEIQRDILLRDVAADLGYKVSVLKDRDERTPGLEYVKKTVQVDNKPVELWHVRFKDGEGETAPLKEQPVTEFAQAKWADFLPALMAESGQQQQQTGGTRHVQQGSGGTSGAGNLFESIRKEAEAETKTSTVQGPTLEERLHMRPVTTA